MGATPTAPRAESSAEASAVRGAGGATRASVALGQAADLGAKASQRLAVATSGGRDSTALLHCAARAGVALGIEVVALHVHHGLQPQADAWMAQVQAQAKRWGLICLSTKLSSKPERGESVEAWARRERYAALAQMAQQAQCGIVLLAHHRADQAETFLLQALRGAGSAGLAAMPRLAVRAGITWARPWLYQPREAIETYVRRHRLKFVDDPSNADPRWDRNRLRLQVLPALRAAFPQADASLAAAADRAAQDAAALASQARGNLLHLQTAVRDHSDATPNARSLDVGVWRALPPAQQRPALREWLKSQQAAPVPHTLLTRLMSGLQAGATASWPWCGGWLRLYRGGLRLQPTAAACAIVPAADADAATAADADADPDAEVEAAAMARSANAELSIRRGEPTPRAITLDLSQPGRYTVARWGGHLVVQVADEGGVPAARLQRATVHARQGGEVFRLMPRGAERSLKKQFQSRAVPAWERTGPLVSSTAGELLFVPGLGMNATHLGAAGERRLILHWQGPGC